jgi:hypothetical protein
MFGWTPDLGMPQGTAERDLVNSLITGSGAHAINEPATAGNVNAALGAGSPVGINILPGGRVPGGHFVVATGGTAEGGLNLGATGEAIGIHGPITLEQLRALGGGLAPIVTLVKDADDAINKLGDDTGTLATTAVDAFGNVTTAVTDAMGTTTTTVTDASGAIVDQFTTMSTEVPAATEGMTGAVLTNVQDLGDGLQTTITDAAGNTVSTVTDLSGNVVAQFGAMADGSNVAMGDLEAGTTTAVTQLADGVETTVTDLSGTTITTFTDLAGNVVGQAVTMADGTVAATGAMAEGVTTTTTDMSGTVTETFTDLLGNVTQTTTDLQGNVTKTFTDTAGTVTTTTTDMSGNVTTTVRNMAGEVVKQFTTVKEGADKIPPAFKAIDKAATSVRPYDGSDTIKNLQKVEKQALSTAKALDELDSKGDKGDTSGKGKSAGKSGSSGEGGRQGFATGGIVSTKGLYWLAEDGPEVVIPLSDLGGRFTSPAALLGAMPAAYAYAGGGTMAAGGRRLAGDDARDGAARQHRPRRAGLRGHPAQHAARRHLARDRGLTWLLPSSPDWPPTPS